MKQSTAKAEPTNAHARAALELAGVRAAVFDKACRPRWCTPAYRSLTEDAGARSAELIEQAVRSFTSAAPQEQEDDGPRRSIVDLIPVGRFQVVASPLRETGDWLVVLTDPPAARGTAGPPGASSRDPVTGLPDRAALEERLAERFQQPGPFALLFIDLNGFKRINDTLGHLAGDRALREAATRMRRTLREDDFIARFGGDEFVAFIERVDSSEDLRPLLDRLGQSMLAPIVFENQEVGVSASIGVALSADGYASSEAMLHAADTRMYASRASAQQRAQAD